MGKGFVQRFLVLGVTALVLMIPHAALCRDVNHGRTTTDSSDAAEIARLSRQLTEAAGQERVRTLIRRGEAYRALGHYPDARRDLREALDAAVAGSQPLLEAVAMQSLGYVHFLEQDLTSAEALLRSALEKAGALDQPILAAASANRLGSVLFARDEQEEARALYQKALDHVIRANDAGLEAAIRINLARTATDDEVAVKQLLAARNKTSSIASDEERARLLLGIAEEAHRRWMGKEGLAFHYEALNEAFSLAAKTGDARLRSLASGKLGELYEKQGRLDEARRLTGQALEAAQSLQAHELLLEWEWQLGRILRAQGQRQKAIAAYRRAVFHIQTIRQDIPIQYQGGRSSFRETLAPIYLGLADMLLEQAGEESEDNVRQSLLREARDTVERIKRSEMCDYFNDPCVDALSRQIGTLSPGTAVLYPIILSDRLEVLVDIGGRMHRKTSEVSAQKLEQTVSLLARDLRDPGSMSHRERGRKVFEWLIRPVAPILDEQQVNTLVFVPDGALRLAPIAALWDGERYLLERYAVVTAPGLTLLDPARLPRGDLYTMLAGMSEPGPVVFEIPGNLWNALSKTESAPADRGVRGITTVEAQLKSSKVSKPEQEKSSAAMERVKKALALPGVEKEIHRLSKDLPANVLLDQEFQLEQFSQDFQEKDYRVVHIASHGFFGGAPEQNFIMTYNKLLNMNQLESLIKPKQFAARPVELLTLSACQTAQGDDRSPLGLTGVALKSGARSGLGSLWPIWDEAAQELFPAFYAHLKDPQNTKAQALQAAQLDLMKQDRFRHPFFWAPFILVGNWL